MERLHGEVLRKVREYVIEVHGSATILVDYMKGCGFEAKLVSSITRDPRTPSLDIWLFRLV